MALYADKDIETAFKAAGVSKYQIEKIIQQMRGGKAAEGQNPEGQYDALTKYGHDLVAMAEQGKLDPVIGRDEEIRRVVRILSRRTKNNPVLIGEPGVGKTAIVEGLAQRIVRGDVPTNLQCKLFALDMVLVLCTKFINCCRVLSLLVPSIEASLKNDLKLFSRKSKSLLLA